MDPSPFSLLTLTHGVRRMTIKAVIFDLGGVVVVSPFVAIYAYEKSEHIPKGGILNVIKKFGDTSAFALLERSAISFDQFCTQFKDECTQCGLPNADGRKFIHHIEQCWRHMNTEMVHAIIQLKKNGIKVAALTNNWYGSGEVPEDTSTRQLEGQSNTFNKDIDLFTLLQRFDVVIESRVVKMRKPDPRIYSLVCDRLDVQPSECVYLDDIGSNLKPARAMGMHTIHVDPRKQGGGVTDAIAELQQHFNFIVSAVPKL